jgi:hypothetical protein
MTLTESIKILYDRMNEIINENIVIHGDNIAVLVLVLDFFSLEFFLNFLCKFYEWIPIQISNGFLLSFKCFIFIQFFIN